MSSLRSRVIVGSGLAAGCIVIGVYACGDEPPAAPIVPPPGAVLQVGPGEYLAEPGWIYAAEVDRWVDTIAMIQPTETRLSWRRKSLTNIVLPMRELALLYPAELAQSQLEVQVLHAAALASELEDEHVERSSGHMLEVGLDRWGVARTLPMGEWSEVFETLAGFCFLRVVEAPPPGEWKGNTKIVIEHVTSYYLPREEIQAAVEDVMSKLKVRAVDPDWEWILPKFYVYQHSHLPE